MRKLCPSLGILVLIPWALLPRAVPAQHLMPEIRQLNFELGGESERPQTMRVTVWPMGEMPIRVVWVGDTDNLLLTLESENGTIVLSERIQASPWKIPFRFPEWLTQDRQQDLVMTVVAHRGIAAGTVTVEIPTREKPEIEVEVEEADKGQLVTERSEGLYPKGRLSQRTLRGPTKKSPDDPIEFLPEIGEAKEPPSREEIPIPARKQPPEAQPDIDSRFLVLRMELMDGRLNLVSSTVLPGPLRISPVVAGDLLWVVTSGDRIVSFDTVPDPRTRRVHLEDGSRYAAVFDDRPAWFKISIPEDALDAKTLENLNIELYALPGELGVTRVDREVLRSIMPRIESLARVESEEIYRVLNNNPDLGATEE